MTTLTDERPRPPTAPLGSTHELATGVYAYVQGDGGWCLSNAGIVRGPEHTIVIDTAATQRRARALMTVVEELAPHSSRIVVNTHSHGDHTLGNSQFPSDVPILAHPSARDEMAAAGLSLTGIWPDVDWGELEVRLPTVLVADSVTIENGGTTLEVRHLGVSHSTNDLIVWLPKERVLFAGDQVLSGCTPFLLFGSVAGARAALAQMLRLEPRTVVPGHGRVGGPGLITATLEYLDWVVAVAKEGLRSRLTPRTLAGQAGPGPFPGWIDRERHVANFHRAYAELEGALPGAPLDLEPVMKDVIACCEHGYPRCRA